MTYLDDSDGTSIKHESQLWSPLSKVCNNDYDPLSNVTPGLRFGGPVLRTASEWLGHFVVVFQCESESSCVVSSNHKGCPWCEKWETWPEGQVESAQKGKDVHGWARTCMDGQGRAWMGKDMHEWARMCTDGQGRAWMGKDGHGWARTHTDGQGWAQMGKDTHGWARMGKEWARMCTDGQGCAQMCTDAHNVVILSRGIRMAWPDNFTMHTEGPSWAR
ncbi:hypothetical protein BDN67DRAFT_983197 [Paxillus ammoniavirescens]|nr:hypothetical protein BDN67DRAFT_983197 [Paxillus ammoniavirescens]